MSATTAEKRACLEREIRMRRRVYPRRVAAGQMRQADADREIRVMSAILDDYALRDLFADPDPASTGGHDA